MHGDQDAPQQPTASEDVEAHDLRSAVATTTARRPKAIEREQPAPDADDDVEGHAMRGKG